MRETLPALHKVWKSVGRINPFVLIWPRRKVEWKGMTTNQSIGFDLPEDKNKWATFLAEAALRNAAFALLLVEQRDREVVAIMESRAGAVSWHLPIEDHGDVLILGTPVEQSGTDQIGLLYRG